MKVVIFDLDGTVIDSTHRHASNPDGSIDLDHWRENSTPAKIALDSLLPLVHKMRTMHKSGFYVVICTARVLSRADYQFFLNNNIPFRKVLSRPRGNDTEDGALKAAQISELLARLNVEHSRAQMFDDNQRVIAAMSQIGIRCHDAKKLNKR